MEKVFYWANVLGGLKAVLVVFLIVSVVVFAFWLGFYLSEVFDPVSNEDKIKHYRKGTLLSFAISIVLSLGIVFIPNKETYLLIQGSKAVEQMYNKSETLQELPKNTVNLLNEYIKTLTKELSENNSE